MLGRLLSLAAPVSWWFLVLEIVFVVGGVARVLEKETPKSCVLP